MNIQRESEDMLKLMLKCWDENTETRTLMRIIINSKKLVRSKRALNYKNVIPQH